MLLVHAKSVIPACCQWVPLMLLVDAKSVIHACCGWVTQAVGCCAGEGLEDRAEASECGAA